MTALLYRFLRDDSGATAIEYGLIAGGIFVAIIAAVTEVGSEVQTPFNDVKAGLK